MIKKLTLLAVLLLIAVPAFAEETNDKVLATVLGQDITESQVAPLASAASNTKKGHIVFKIALQPLIDNFIKQQYGEIEISEDEIEAFETTMPPVVRHKQDVEKNLREFKEQFPDAKEEYKQLEEKLTKPDHQIARIMIYNWKRSKLLYDHFGGEVISQQLGPEPLAAFRALIRQAEKDGDLVLRDMSLKEDFDWYLRPNVHTMVCKAEEKPCEVMEKPWWLLKQKEVK